MNLVEKMTLNISKPTDANDLRALYLAVKGGAPMPHALVRAALNGLADKDCAAKARRAFEALGLEHRVNVDLNVLEAAAHRGDYLAIVNLSCGSREYLWASAMTAHFGPTGTSKALKNSDGTPSQEALAAYPHIAAKVSAAREKVIGLIAYYRRRETALSAHA